MNAKLSPRRKMPTLILTTEAQSWFVDLLIRGLRYEVAKSVAARWARKRLVPARRPYPGSVRSLFEQETRRYIPARLFYPLLRTLGFRVAGGPIQFHCLVGLRNG